MNDSASGMLLVGLTTVTRIHVRDQRRAKWIKVGDHLGIIAHVMQLSNRQIRLAETGGSCPCTSLIYISGSV